MWRLFLRVWRWLRAEIVFGFLIGSVFWAAVLGWQTAYAPTDAEKQECYEGAHKAGHKSEECKSFWERSTSDPVAFFTLVLAVSTIGLWVATIFLYYAGERQFRHARRSAAIQSRDMQDSIRVGQRSADAAMKAAETAEKALVFEQRPWLTWNIRKVKVFRAGRHIQANVDTTFENTGKTPAVAVHYAARLYVVKGGAVVNVGVKHLDEMFAEYVHGNPLILTTILPDEKPPKTLAFGCTIEVNELDPSPTKQFQLYLAIHAGYRLFDGGRIAEIGCLYMLKAHIQRQTAPSGPIAMEQVDFSFELIDSRPHVPTFAVELPSSRRVT